MNRHSMKFHRDLWMLYFVKISTTNPVLYVILC